MSLRHWEYVHGGSCPLCLLSFPACEIDDFTQIVPSMKYLVFKNP